MTVLLAGLPILLILLGFLRGFASWQTGLLALVATAALAGGPFHASPAAMSNAIGVALFTAMTTITILGPALLLYALVQASGAIASVSHTVRDVPERDLLVLFLALGVSGLLEAVCGFGTGIVVCVPLYLALDIKPQRAALLGLLGESSTAYASMGNALGLEAVLTRLPANTLGMASALLIGPFSLVCAFLTLMSTGGPHSVRRWWPVAGVAALLLTSGEWAASSLGAESAGALSSLLVCFTLGGLLWWRRNKRVAGWKRMPWRTWKLIAVPLSIVLGGQLLLRAIAPLRSLATRSMLAYGAQHMTIALHPGTWLLLACLSVLLLLRDRSAITVAWKQTQQRLFPLATTIGAFLMISSLMQVSGMIETLTSLFAPVSGAYLEIAPLLGVLGGWMTGSNTSSNALFAVTQVALAEQFHLNILWIAAAQNAAASFGRLVAPLCLYLATSAAGVRERALLVPAWWLIALALIGAEAVLVLRICSSPWIALLSVGGFALLILSGALYSLWQRSRAESARATPSVSVSLGKEIVSEC